MECLHRINEQTTRRDAITEVFQDFAIFNRKPSSVVHACAKRHAVIMHVYDRSGLDARL